MSTQLQEYQRTYQRNRYWERKNKIFKILGEKCCVCGSVADLEIHHKNPNEKEFDPGSREREKSAFEAELKKCELLCGRCHKEKHATSHGSVTMYRVYGCRCAACVDRHRRFKQASDDRHYKKIKADPVKMERRRENWRKAAARRRGKCKAPLEVGVV